MTVTTTTLSFDAARALLDGTNQAIVQRYSGLASLINTCSFGKFDSDIVVLDTEATGLSLDYDDLIQVAAARIENGQVVDWFVEFAKPHKTISYEIEHLTHISNDDVANADSPDEVVERLVKFVGTSTVVAHNIAFDKTLLCKYPPGSILAHNLWIDSLDLARIALPRLKGHRLIDLAHAFNVRESTHRADDDVRTTCTVFRILLAAVCSMPLDLVRYISQLNTQDFWTTRAVFEEFLAHPPLNTPLHAECVKRNELFHGKNADAEALAVPLSMKLLVPARVMRKADVDASAGGADAADACGGSGQAPSGVSHSSTLDQLTDTPTVIPSQEEIQSAFSASGIMGALYEHYEPRDAQVEMAQTIRDAFQTGANVVIEAGTGVGKSLAYLMPAVLTAHKSKVRIGVATSTNTLLDQIYYNDLPRLNKQMQASGVLPYGFTYAAIKGIVHYPCLRKVEILVHHQPELVELRDGVVSQAPALASLVSFIEQSNGDTVDALKIDKRTIYPSSFTSTSAECYKKKCPFYSRCFYFGAKQAVEDSDIFITNHSLMCCNMAADNAILPLASCWIVDEAHDIELAAREAFTRNISSGALIEMANELTQSSDENIFEKITHTVLKEAPAKHNGLFYHITEARRIAQNFSVHAKEYAQAVKYLLEFDAERSKQYDMTDVWLNTSIRSSDAFNEIAYIVTALYNDCNELLMTLQNIAAALSQEHTAVDLQQELSLYCFALNDALDAMYAFFAPALNVSRETSHTSSDEELESNDDNQAQPARDADVQIGTAPAQTLASDAHATTTDAEPAASAPLETLQQKQGAVLHSLRELQALIGTSARSQESCQSARETSPVAANTTTQASADTSFQSFSSQADQQCSSCVGASDNAVYMAHMHRKKTKYNDVLSVTPLAIASKLENHLYDLSHSVVFTSATLSVNKSLDGFMQTVGLSHATKPCVHKMLNSPYDYNHNMVIYVVRDFPEPNNALYLEALERFLAQVHKAQHGSLLTLFTNRHTMEQCYETVRPVLVEQGMNLLCQKKGSSTKTLRDMFINEKTASLFALKSFWQGFDAPGDTLQGVIIPKLPFGKPNDPLSLERSERDPQAWMHYSLPQAIIETKQAVGRLIRKCDDKGFVIFTDVRLVKKSYGKIFLNSMPTQAIRVLSAQDICNDIYQRRLKNS